MGWALTRGLRFPGRSHETSLRKSYVSRLSKRNVILYLRLGCPAYVLCPPIPRHVVLRLDVLFLPCATIPST
jgi:hypothetical protein